MTHLEDAVGPSSLAPTTRICGQHQASSRVPTRARQPEWCGVRTCVEATAREWLRRAGMGRCPHVRGGHSLVRRAQCGAGQLRARRRTFVSGWRRPRRCS